LGELLKYAYHYQTFSLAPQLNFNFNKHYKIKLSYAYTPYFYFKDNNNYNHYRNRLTAMADIKLKHIGYTQKALKFLLDISNRNYLHKISRNRLGKRTEENQLWNWTFYSASIKFFEEVDYNRDMSIRYAIEWKDDNFEGYYNYLEQYLELNYDYFFNPSHSISLTADISYRKYRYRLIEDEQTLQYWFPEVGLQYNYSLTNQLKFEADIQTYSRNSNFNDRQLLTKRNYFSLFMEVVLSYDFVKK